MSPLVVRPEELARASLRTADDGTESIDLSNPRVYSAPTETFWGLVLLIAVRDRATSVHYHPWRGEGALSEVVDDIRHEMIAPDAEVADEIVKTARSLFVGRRRLWSRLVGRGSTSACRSLSLEVSDRSCVWDAVVWSSGGRSGVELYRVTPLERPKAKADDRGPNDTLPI